MEMGAYTREAKRIVEESYRIVEKFVKGSSPEDYILKRCIIATGDPSVKDIIVFKNDPIRAGIKAIKDGKTIITDVSMVKAGIRCDNVIVAVEHSEGAERLGTTRTATGFYNLKDKIGGSVVAIGNSPSAALAVYDLVKKGYKPSLIVATPVGFVNAAESKEMIRSLDVPSITTVGTRGGSTLCVAIVNGIIELARAD